MDQGWRNQLALSASKEIEIALSYAHMKIGEEHEYDSPLEYAFATALMLKEQLAYYGCLEFVAEFGQTADACAERMTRKVAYRCGLVFPQVHIGNYRVDFLLVHTAQGGGVGRVVIECDGHDFHERTAEQAARDRRRDRELQSQNYKVLRFTGAEIWRDPLSCADAATNDAMMEAFNVPRTRTAA